MGSSLTWIDYDPSEQERMKNILALFKEKDTLDELGLGAVRDAFSEILFPGLNTIQTRLRYMLIIPWLYIELEKARVPSRDIARRARDFEYRISECLVENGESEGVFGRLAGRQLKRLPSSIYWLGLGAWGIRRFEGSQDEYHRSLDGIYARRKSSSYKDDGDVDFDPASVTWHLKIPPAPQDFPESLDLKLTREESGFLLDCILRNQGHTLLAHLASSGGPAEVDFPWEHPRYAGFSDVHKEILYHARLFSQVMYGAVLLYNLMLSELKGEDEGVDRYTEWFGEWLGEIDIVEVREWDLRGLWNIVESPGHVIDLRTKGFVTTWVGSVSSNPGGLMDSGARNLVRNREVDLKKGRSRFVSPAALDRWGGGSGLNRLDYRWNVARNYLRELYEGFENG